MANKRMLACEKKWVIISDRIARTESEMAIFVLKRIVEQNGPSEAMPLFLHARSRFLMSGARSGLALESWIHL